MEPQLRIIFLEDSAEDVEMMLYELNLAHIHVHAKQVSTKEDYLRALHTFDPDVIISDYFLPEFNGMHAFRLMQQQEIDVPFILVSGTLTQKLLNEFYAEGPDDILQKNQVKRLPVIIDRTLRIKKAERDLKKASAELLLLKDKSELEKIQHLLTEREYQILCLIGSGKTIREIAGELFISPATVATYRSRTLEKLQLKSNVDLTRYALLHGLIG